MKKGFSLLDLVLVLGITAMMISGAFMIYPKVSSNAKVNKEIKNITFLVNGLTNLYKGQSDLSGISTIVAVNAKLVPNDMLIPGNTTTLRNGWGGIVTIGASGTGATGFATLWHSLTLTENAIPSDECVKFSKQIYDQFYNQNSLTGLIINSTYVYNRTGNGNSTAPLSMDDIVAACEKKETSTIQLTIRPS